MTTDGDDDRKPSAVSDNTEIKGTKSADGDAGATGFAPSSSSSTLQAMRSSYADAFLERCEKVDPNSFDLPVGRTYICPWMPPSEELYKETYFGCGNCDGFSVNEITADILQCKYCDKRVYCNPGHAETEEMRLHFNNGCPQYARKTDQINHEIEQLEDVLKKSEGKIDHLKNSKGKSDQLANVFRLRSEVYERKFSLCNTLFDMRKKENRWDVVEKQKNAEPITGVDRLEYWASRCRTNDMEYFDSFIMRRPDTHCALGLKTRHEGKRLDFGSHVFRVSLIPSNSNMFPGYSACAMQATWEPYKDINYDYSDELYRLGLAYTKDAVWAYEQVSTWAEDHEEFYPFMPSFVVPLGGVNKEMERNMSPGTLLQHGGPNSDVWTYERTDIGTAIKPVLNNIASLTNDCPLPRYQMIIDPNQFVRPRQTDGKKVWVPCEFDVNSDGSKASLVGGQRAHWMKSSMIDAVATPVLTAALPLLARLTKPHMLLEGQRLQVVVKAQSITVPKKQPDDDPPEYIGLWHVDGEHEPVAAVVLYYYDVDDALVGGNMEFLDRRPITLLGFGKSRPLSVESIIVSFTSFLTCFYELCLSTGDTNAHCEIHKGALRRGLRPDGSEPPQIPNCSVPIRSGTMLVFSNYQMAHRVLRMVNTSTERPASRNFVALFVMDPAAKRLVPSAAHLARSYLYKRSLTGKCMNFPRDTSSESMPEAVAELVMEFLGIIPSLLQRRATRNELLRSQLIPKQTLGRSREMVCTTGNGCLTMIGWIDSLLTDHRHRPENQSNERYDDIEFKKAENRIDALNYPPQDVGRGLSETLSIPSDDLEEMAMFYDTAGRRNEQLNDDLDKKLLES
eukprot:CAMPEP_0113443108 /NCGR_PEP_ID=MMETSP0014_2-20120614/1963_1 /TAXON_ID=2857 /ORGANISM="Nitzschia sp." /LENGTH=846 /DNA_ID=CAMNT_0000334043 /DNA_START=210 /DNA_END=2750 /DNA_ORIENTATION=+ /assembly_acc=CAM_ASM_000159